MRREQLRNSVAVMLTKSVTAVVEESFRNVIISTDPDFHRRMTSTCSFPTGKMLDGSTN